MYSSAPNTGYKCIFYDNETGYKCKLKLGYFCKL